MENHLHSESFTYDADGNITRLQRSDDQNHQATTDYRYDRMDNLVSMNCQRRQQYFVRMIQHLVVIT